MMQAQAERKIGVLGGTFNPVHVGHLIMVQDALEMFELEQVLLVPCARPPHKAARNLLDAEHRVAMLEHAVEGDPRLAVSRVEIERGGVSYTVDTMRSLKALFPGASFYFIIGADTLTELHTWRNVYDLLGMCEFITFGRPGVDAETLDAGKLRLKAPWSERLLARVAKGHPVGISSSEIRVRVAEGMSIRYLVPSAVEMYIYEHGLYKA